MGTSMSVRDLRFVSAVAIIAAGLFAFASGGRMVQVLVAHPSSGSVENGGRGSRAAIPGLAVYGLEALLVGAVDQIDTQAVNNRLTALIELLSVKPLSAFHWLSLSGMRVVAGQRGEQTVAALGLSALTGPNEGHVFLQRALFTISIWELLPAETRGRIANDLNDKEVFNSGKARLRTVVAAKPEAVRLEIGSILRGAGALSEPDLAQIGL